MPHFPYGGRICLGGIRAFRDIMSKGSSHSVEDGLPRDHIIAVTHPMLATEYSLIIAEGNLRRNYSGGLYPSLRMGTSFTKKGIVVNLESGINRISKEMVFPDTPWWRAVLYFIGRHIVRLQELETQRDRVGWVMDDVALSCIYVLNPGHSFGYIPWAGALYFREYTRHVKGTDWGRIIVDREGDDGSPIVRDNALNSPNFNYYEMRDAVAAKIRAYIAASKPNT